MSYVSNNYCKSVKHSIVVVVYLHPKSYTAACDCGYIQLSVLDLILLRLLALADITRKEKCMVRIMCNRDTPLF